MRSSYNNDCVLVKQSIGSLPPPDKVHNKFCKYILGLKKWASNIASRSELGRLPIDCFTKTQSLLYEDRILANDTLLILKEYYSLSK
jgi:hypothetical protein